MADDEHTLPHEAVDAAVLGLIHARHPAPVHVADLARAFEGDDWHTSVRALIDDGALYREGSLLVVSRCTVRVAAMAG